MALAQNTSLTTIGLLGGSFDPVHNGHLFIAKETMKLLNLAQVHLIPCITNVLKQNPPEASAVQRSIMLHLATKNQKGLIVDDRELRRAGPSYTIDTLTEIRQEFMQSGQYAVSLCLLLASDVFMQVDAWHDWCNILPLTHIVILPRPNQPYYLNSVLAKFAQEHKVIDPKLLHQSPSGYIYVLNIKRQQAICGSDIRLAIRAGKDVSKQMPAEVWAYIKQHHLYQPP